MIDKLPRNRIIATICGIMVAITGFILLVWLEWTYFGIAVVILGAIWITAAMEGERL